MDFEKGAKVDLLLHTLMLVLVAGFLTSEKQIFPSFKRRVPFHITMKVEIFKILLNIVSKESRANIYHDASVVYFMFYKQTF